MQTIILSFLFGAVCTMVLWVVGSAAAKRDMMIRRGGRLAFWWSMIFSGNRFHPRIKSEDKLFRIML
jgi:hypothetical protein